MLVDLVGWFTTPRNTTDDQLPAPERLASSEFVSGLIEIAESYERREQMHRILVKTYAEKLSQKEHFNYQELDRALFEIREAVLTSLHYQGLAAEVRDWIRDYEHHGRRPPYMPKLPPQEETRTGGE